MSVQNLSLLGRRVQIRRGLIFGLLIVSALFAFEIFNYSTTDFALKDLLGELSFVGISWATILAIAFCGIDFAGIARLFTPEKGTDEPTEVWYLFGAWMLAATMNAMLTWWGVSIAILNHESLGNSVVARETLIKVVPVFVAIMVWLIRVLIIGTISVAGDKLFSQGEVVHGQRPNRVTRNRVRQTPRPNIQPNPISASSRSGRGYKAPTYKPAPKPKNHADKGYNQEPTYHPVSMKSNNSESQRQTRF